MKRKLHTQNQARSNRSRRFAALPPSVEVGVAPCLFDLNGHAPAEFRLLPFGTFKAKDGRPYGLQGWRLDAYSAAAALRNIQSLADDFLIDYEHQTLYTDKTGQKAPASAWVSRADFEIRDDGIYATNIEWTEAAKAAIEAKEYRYISPVIQYDKKTGVVTGALMAALVNHAAIDGLTDLAAAHFSFNVEEDSPVDKETLALLGLDENASPEQIAQAVAALKAQADQVESLTDQVAALKANSDPGKPDPAKYVPVETMSALQQQVAELSNQVNRRDCDELIEAALSDGRLLEAQKSWAQSLEIEALKAYLKDAQPIAALKSTQTGGNDPEAGGENGLTADELAVCKATGIDQEAYKKTRGDQ